MKAENAKTNGSIWDRVRLFLFGAPKQIKDPSLFHKITLIPLLAWIGLGADGLSSSAYGPEEAFRALGSHSYLAVLLGLVTAVTVFIIAYAYCRIIEHFPHGGGGYVVATQMLGEKTGLVSGSALLVDYVLTITVSIASCADAIFSYLPMELHKFKIIFACFLIFTLIILNIRGVKESIAILAPIFVVFIVSHVVLLLDGVFTHTDQFGRLAESFEGNLHNDLSTIGGLGVLMLFLHAYSLGGGTYTGIEAVSNGLQIMREPRVQTGKRTMVYMAVSLALTSGILFVCYSLLSVKPTAGRTLNAVLADAVYADWPLAGSIAFITIFSEGALLLVAAQTGFVDGPRVMSNMAVDSWLPHRFAALSERLTMRNGIVLMGIAAVAVLLYTKGSVSSLVVMYSINVFVTFSLSQLSMIRLVLSSRGRDRKWKQHLIIHGVGLVLCATILVITVIEKFAEGGWVTLAVTSVVIAGCYWIRGHYREVQAGMTQLNESLINLPASGKPNSNPLDPDEMTAIQLVSSYSGFGIHTFLSIMATFPKVYKNVVFVSVAVMDSGSFKGAEEVDSLEKSVKNSLEKYVTLARKLGLPATYRMCLTTDVVQAAVSLCKDIREEFPRSTVFAGQLTFRLEKFYHRMLHNETAFAIQRNLQWEGITTVILPVRAKI
ncbi:MAG: APC family permease [Pseudomonadota bacterium]